MTEDEEKKAHEAAIDAIKNSSGCSLCDLEKQLSTALSTADVGLKTCLLQGFIVGVFHQRAAVLRAGDVTDIMCREHLNRVRDAAAFVRRSFSELLPPELVKAFQFGGPEALRVVK